MSSFPPGVLDHNRRFRLSGRDRPRWMRKLGYWLWWITHDGAAPEFVARGIGVGIFAGVLPILGQSFVAIPLAWLVRGSKVIAVAMTFVSNPLTTFPIFFFDYWVGCFLLGLPLIEITPNTFESWENVSKLGTDFIGALFLGGVVVAIVSGTAAYFLGHAYVARVGRIKAKRRAEMSQLVKSVHAVDPLEKTGTD